MQIYEDNELKQIMNEIRSKDPDFNATAYFKQKLKEKVQFGDKLDRQVILKNIEDLEYKRSLIQNQIDYFKEKEKQALVQEELERQEKSLVKKQEEERVKNEEKVFLDNKNWFEEETGKELTKELYEEFRQGLHGANFWKFIDKFKEAKE